MPYLIQMRKNELDDGFHLPTTAGDLTYLLTRAMQDPSPHLSERLEIEIGRYLKNRPQQYENYATVLGCLMSTGLEYARRVPGAASQQRLEELQDFIHEYYINVIAPYEDAKIRQNGDVY